MDVITTEYHDDTQVADGPTGSHSASVKPIITGKLHFRMANVGQEGDGKGSKIHRGAYTGLEYCFKNHGCPADKPFESFRLPDGKNRLSQAWYSLLFSSINGIYYYLKCY